MTQFFRNLLIIGLITFALFEIVLRIALFTDVLNIPILRRPGLYANPYGDNDYWKLRHQLAIKYQRANPRTHELTLNPIQGWVPKKTEENPLGIIAETAYSVDSREKTALFYGDSFVEGDTLMEHKMPQVLDRMIPDTQVLNFGVGGYGLDQIFLRFHETHSLFDDPLILFGILDRDVHRILLNNRGRPKPYFEIEEGELALRGTPVPLDDEKWYTENPVTIKSYAFAAFTQLFRQITGTRDSYRQDEKEEIASKILEAVVQDAKAHDLRIVFVIFSRKDTWSKIFLIDELERLDMPYLDAQHFIGQHRKNHPGEIFSYSGSGGHPNKLAHKLMMQGLLDYLKELDLI